MGSKSKLLDRGLRDGIDSALYGASAFVDLFSGTGSVAIDVSKRWNIPVTAVDVQEYARILAAAVLERPANVPQDELEAWLASGEEGLPDAPPRSFGPSFVYELRQIAASSGRRFVFKHYAGHYFSERQAVAFDNLLDHLPQSGPIRDLCLAAVIAAASDCAAAPGHTAQPFQPTLSALPHIATAWAVDPLVKVRKYLNQILSERPRRTGRAQRTDALAFLDGAQLEGAVVFCDPPYSQVQYSRFYHVLEGISRGGWAEVAGAGRAPSRTLRFASDYSSKRASGAAFQALFEALRESGASGILTFPNHLCSNGQSAASLAILAEDVFDVELAMLDGRHSSLGATSNSPGGRVAHRDVAEAVLFLRPK